jgi:hypothetical protein
VTLQFVLAFLLPCVIFLAAAVAPDQHSSTAALRDSVMFLLALLCRC